MSALKSWFRRSLAAQLVISMLLIAGVSRLARPHQSPAFWGLQIVLYGAIGAAFAFHRRRKDTAETGSDPEAVQSLGRKIMHGTVPSDPGERDAMRRLVTYRLRLLRRTRWAVPAMGVVMALLVALTVSTAQWSAAAFAAFSAACVGLMVWARRRAGRKLHHMDAALGREQPTLQH
jgi:hypothetical protein